MGTRSFCLGVSVFGLETSNCGAGGDEMKMSGQYLGRGALVLAWALFCSLASCDTITATRHMHGLASICMSANPSSNLSSKAGTS